MTGFGMDVDAALGPDPQGGLSGATVVGRAKPGPKPGAKRGGRKPALRAAAATRAPEREAPRTAPRVEEREEPRLERKRKGTAADQFYIDPDDIPHGMDWNWKRTEVLGKDMEDFHQQGLADNGWSPVDAAKHRKYSSKASGAITRPGYVLMERPSYLTREAEEEIKETALGYERQKREELMLPDNVIRGRETGIRKSFGPIDVPEN